MISMIAMAALLIGVFYCGYRQGKVIGREEENHRCRMLAWDHNDAAYQARGVRMCLPFRATDR